MLLWWNRYITNILMFWIEKILLNVVNISLISIFFIAIFSEYFNEPYLITLLSRIIIFSIGAVIIEFLDVTNDGLYISFSDQVFVSSKISDPFVPIIENLCSL